MKPKKVLTPKHFGTYEKLSSIQNRRLGVSSCALASGCKVIVSGDKHLLKVSGYQGIDVLKPRTFVDTYLVWREVFQRIHVAQKPASLPRRASAFCLLLTDH